MKFVRGLAGVAIGFALFVAALRMVSPSDGLARNATVTILAALVSGFITALIAGSHEFPWAASVGMLMIGAGFITMMQQEMPRPGWYEMTIAGCGPAAALLGAAIRLLTKPRTKRPQA
ncbi:MAG TPA: hypothetical protein VG273_08065 [Bryobacteraceae bacterium]|nr:hypothetical protein [Bryobacteraceae bacterium]